MATKKPSNQSCPAKAGKGQIERTEVCTRHGEVKICGQPNDVERIMLLLAQQERDQPEIPALDVANTARDSHDEISDTATPSSPSEDARQDVVESPDADDNCPCWKPEFGRKRQITEEGES